METTTETPKMTVEAVDLTTLDPGLYTETVTVNPNADPSAPARPLDEAIFDANGKEVRKIVYVANITAPAEGGTDNFGHPRTLSSRMSGTKKDGTPWTAFKLAFDLKIVGIADVNADQSQISGRSGKFFDDVTATSFVREDGNGEPYSELSQLARCLGLLDGVQLAEGEKVVGFNNLALATAVAEKIKTGTAQVGVTIYWAGDYQKSEKDASGKVTKRGRFNVNGARNFPRNADGSRSPVLPSGSRATVKFNGFERLA